MIGKIFNHQQSLYQVLWLSKLVITPKMPFYAVAKGRTPGIFMTWPDCEAQVKGYAGARYKKFDTAAAAESFITTVAGSPMNKQSNSLVRPKNQPGTSNLKRKLNTSAPNFSNNAEQSIPQKKPKPKSKTKSNSDSDNSEDLNTILIKQMDDIEKRLKGFEKGVDKIIKKSTKGDRKTVLIEPQCITRPQNVSNGFERDQDGYVHVYTDGACSANGKSGAKAGLGVYWGEGHSLNISAPVSGRATNNCGEIQAATCAIKMALENGVNKLAINTDSKFLINSVTKWMKGWKQKGWKLKSGEPVKNEKDFKDLDSVQNKLQIKWNYVEAHRGIHGNEKADQLAKAGAAMYNK